MDRLMSHPYLQKKVQMYQQQRCNTIIGRFWVSIFNLKIIYELVNRKR